jgi:sigma-B regulation protein RsbU (phosphoserine phosphatase)
VNPVKDQLAHPGDPPARALSPDDSERDRLLARIACQEAEIESLCAEVSTRYEEATFVYRLSERIGSVLGERAIAALVVKEAALVLGAHAAELWLKCQGSIVRAAALPGAARVDPTTDAAPPAVCEAIANGRSAVDETASGRGASAVVPLPDGPGAYLGALALSGRSEGRSYLAGEIKLMTAIAALAAAFIRNERLADKARGADARRREDEIARQVHRGLLPRHDPLFAGLDVSGGFKAADGVGGDYYGYVAMADGSLGVAIADVSGHGVGAALYMAIAKGALESEARDTLSSGDVLGRVNEVLASDFSTTDMFATLVFARFLPDARRIIWSNAGHNPPLLLRRDGSVEWLKPCGPALGIVAGARWRDVDQRFAEGDVIVLYTDGVVEARDASRRFFGTDRLVEAVRRPAGSAAEMRANVLESLARHAGTVPLGDDFTLIVARGVAIEDGS